MRDATEFGASAQTSIELRPNLSAPRLARRAVRSVCAESGVPARVVQDAARVAGALVTASVRQAKVPVRILVVVGADEVTVRVRDGATMAPAGLDGIRTSERTWELVRRLGSSWGYHNAPGRREMWALLRLPSTEPTGAGAAGVAQ